MSVLRCSCGNTNQWINLTMDSTGTRATCGGCGSAVHDPNNTSTGSFRLDRATTTGTTVIGDHQVVVSEIRISDHRPAHHQEPPRPREPQPREARPHRRTDDGDRFVTDGPTVFGADSRAYGPGAQAYGPGSRAYGPGARTFDPTATTARDAPHYVTVDEQRYLLIDGRRIAVHEYTPRPDRDPGSRPATSTTIKVDPTPSTSQDLAGPAAASQGETHQDLTAADLAAIADELARANEQVDALAQTRTNLQALVDRCSERVAAHGGTPATAQALEAAQQAIAQLNQAVGLISQSAVEAEDATGAAHAGLAPAREAQDALHSAGATGEFVSAATSD